MFAHRLQTRSGFTMVEMMMGSAIGVIVMAGVFTTYILCLKQFRAISNYAEIHRDGRKSVDQFSQDFRGVRSISSYNASNLVVIIPTAFSTTGSAISNKTVTYAVNKGALWRTDSSTGKTSMLSTNISTLTFSLFDKLGTNTTTLSTAKGVQVDIKLRKTLMSQIQSEDFLSARLDMRNIP
jgi:prepilin-type N-terminal cleavage/methylation domain-containing protein